MALLMHPHGTVGSTAFLALFRHSVFSYKASPTKRQNVMQATTQKNPFSIRPATGDDEAWLERQSLSLGGPVIVNAGELIDLRKFPSFVAAQSGQPVGFVTFRCGAPRADVLAINVLERGAGIGTALLAKAEAVVRENGASCIRICTTNDNTRAFRFYQQHRYVVRDYWVGGFADVLKQKGLQPETEVMGEDAIRIRDIIILEKPVAPEAPPT